MEISVAGIRQPFRPDKCQIWGKHRIRIPCQQEPHIAHQKLPQSGIDNFRVEDGVELREYPAVQPPLWTRLFDQFPFDEHIGRVRLELGQFAGGGISGGDHSECVA